MDLENQRRILELSERHGRENVVLVLGSAEAEAASLAVETVTTGDPTFAGPLAGVSLGLRAYHIFELKEEVNRQVYDEQCGMMEMVLNMEAIVKEMNKAREEFLPENGKGGEHR